MSDQGINLLKNMIKEEWRIHTTLFGNLNFLMVPILILFFGALSSLFGSIFRQVFAVDTLVIVSHVSFLFFGMAIGSFGIHGQEFMNRRFGQASLLSYSSRSLPISEKRIFMAMVIKDIIYYFLIWIIPLLIGFFLLESILFSPDLVLFFNSFLSLSISFMLGLTSVFFLSTLYANSLTFFIMFLLGLIPSLFLSESLRRFVSSLIVPLTIITSGDLFGIFLIPMLILVFILFSVVFVKFDFKQSTALYDNEYPALSKKFAFTRFRVFLSKDYLDLKRSRGGLGKIIFSYAIPTIFIYYFVDFFRTNVINTSFTMMFSILLGVFSASIYTWITEHDLFTQYIFLPVKKSELMKSKISTFFVLNIISYLIILGISLFNGELAYLISSYIVFSAVSFYSLSLTIFLTGLLPSIRFMNAKVLAAYIMSIVPVMLLVILTYEFFTVFIFPLVLIIVFSSYVMMRKAFIRWDKGEEQTF
ncbi:MAG: hypothetical protein ACLFTR_00610 [Candidatus Woesearchaeota archaeon]